MCLQFSPEGAQKKSCFNHPGDRVNLNLGAKTDSDKRKLAPIFAWACRVFQNKDVPSSRLTSLGKMQRRAWQHWELSAPDLSRKLYLRIVSQKKSD